MLVINLSIVLEILFLRLYWLLLFLLMMLG